MEPCSFSGNIFIENYGWLCIFLFVSQGQLNSISPFRDGYYSNQQGLPVLVWCLAAFCNSKFKKKFGGNIF